MKRSVPVTIAQQLEIDITGLNHFGEGVGRYQGFTLFIPGGIPGDRLLVEIISIQKNYARALLQSVINSSPFRINPTCTFYPECGGCQLQHISYPAQLKLKTQLVKETLSRIGSIDPDIVKETKGMKNPWNYRNKAQYPVRLQKSMAVTGFFAPRSHNLIAIDRCKIQCNSTEIITETIIGIMNQKNISAYNEKTGRGLIRHVLVRESFYNGEVMVVLVTNGETIPQEKELVKALKQRVPNLVSIVQNINTRRDNIILGKKEKVIFGKDHIIESVGNFKFKISPGSFFQVNPKQAKVLYDTVLEYAGLTGIEVIFDLYCGTGSIALYLAPNSAWVYGIEMVPQAAQDAQENAQLNQVQNSEFFVGKAEEYMPKLMKKGVIPDTVVVDPPRKGCHRDLLQSILEAEPRKIIYVSCNPSTLARDLAILTEKNIYRIAEVQPIDMFPHTYHVETLVLMSKK
ncbi:23S rRNA (uracil(1939)-C(5))-methyltransferase RlmD [Candidatus Contubernalis alkaliaceticus]|uniref:23S rRNA (uracil(1939)-C(5))-methyltransferase RlmD n=1 Tax=Candidatus Contubernalis alkaliaceticus TaxID=338645 RepID=UPI001F4C371B|nr:23S rRNA (uracil(1939)-C(5))-methyltransferase RlmD [Candidatus Contubernalis alkalaceticus]UNC92460.1 23S rRNA (uracil(1939)-C(5))-methyltransferase RlmD [Candidatus Contubernalis alkalaceticus]